MKRSICQELIHREAKLLRLSHMSDDELTTFCNTPIYEVLLKRSQASRMDGREHDKMALIKYCDDQLKRFFAID